MENEELLKNRREVGLKICRQIRQNNFQMINTKNFLERPYWDREKKQKFNTTNYLRLLASEKNYSGPRWYSESDIQRKRIHNRLSKVCMWEILIIVSADDIEYS